MFTEGASDATDELIGSLVDERYKVLESMAAGSMGAVYKAERVPVGKIVAIKFLHASFANDPEFLARFERETRVMSKLAHPNCVSVVDFGVWEGAPYLVMEYVGGQTLRSMLDDGPLLPTRALNLTRQISAGLAHAHTQGIVHRDVKPANIMISEEIGAGEHVRILDFGLARLRGAVGRDATQTNVVVGTPNYMAPEQTIGGGTIDARTDVYAVGIVLFEMIAGERPFHAEDTLALLGMHRAAPIPKLVDRVEHTVVLPAGLQDIVDKAMAKSPDDRYQSAIELAAAIDALTGAKSAAEPIVVSSKKPNPVAIAPTVVDMSSTRVDRSQPRRGSNKAGALLALLVLAGGAGAAWYLKNRSERDPARGEQGGSSVVVVAQPGSGSVAAIELPGTPAGADGVGSAGSASAVTAGSNDAVGSGSAMVDLGPGSAGAGSDAPDDSDDGIGGGSGEIEMAPDPMSATNPAPEDPDKPGPEDEAEDAPKDTADVEKRAPIAAARATTIHEAVKLIQDGQRDLALASLRSIWKKTPNSAYVPFLLGNLYFDQTWWSVAMDHYRIAIAKNAGYKRNATLNRNIIRMLGSARTNKKAQVFLKKTIGRASLPYLRTAAKSDKNPHVKKWAAYVLRMIK
ncbi:MAG: protein kinase [Myxococcota bacterium]|nr:protein kinase [Myxococcota bacterium]